MSGPPNETRPSVGITGWELGGVGFVEGGVGFVEGGVGVGVGLGAATVSEPHSLTSPNWVATSRFCVPACHTFSLIDPHHLPAVTSLGSLLVRCSGICTSVLATTPVTFAVEIVETLLEWKAFSLLDADVLA